MNQNNTEALNNSSSQRDYQKEAIGTYVEQTKILITIASTFVVAPAATVLLLRDVDRVWFVYSELAFVFSVLAGYVVFATIAGNQHKNRFDVHDLKTRVCSRFQIGLFLIGLILFIRMIYLTPPSTAQPPKGTQPQVMQMTPNVRQVE